MRPGRFGAQALGVVTGGHEEHSGRVRANTVEGEQPRGMRPDEGDDELVEAVDLLRQELGTSAELF